ncbi:MAG TPA: TIM barrel protein [Candidatus Nanoarchaeia archaeon]|nr:TIM barrel protein [Candidatus Nanoarchaeia archaeon]
MDTLIFGTSGIPHIARGLPTQEAIPQIRKLGLDAMELEFVHSINISREKAPLVKEAARKSDILLTCHAPFFINLNSQEKPKLEASMKRIVDSARITHLCGGYSTTFHAAFYQKETKEATYNNVKDSIKKILAQLKEEGIEIWIRPETTGKSTQFGDIDEILKVSEELEWVMPCIDFANIHARSIGKFNSYEEFSSILQKVEKTLGKRGLQNIHAHITGIAYGEKGEKHHLDLEESDLRYKELLQAFVDFKVRGVAICESPNIESDALLMQKAYKGMSRK